MPSYHVLNIDGLGEMNFFGNLGAVAEYEDKTGISISQLVQDGTVKLSKAIHLVYECHLVACQRLKLDPVDFADFKAYADKSYLDVFLKLMNDITDQLKDDQKKTLKKVAK